MDRICSRCHAVLRSEDDGSLVYCWNCGSPQVQLSTELAEQAEAQRLAITQEALGVAAAEPAEVVPPKLNRWTGAIQCAGLAGAIAAALTLIAFALPPVSLLALLWGVVAPIVILGVYAARFRNTRITAGFAARLGMLCGASILLAIFSLDTVRLCVDRFLLHSAADVDAQLATAFAQQAVALKAQLGAEATPILAKLKIPEFRAGLILLGCAMVSAVYLVYSAAAGAFAGLLRSRSSAG
jgi:hypothetical protein